MGEVKFHFCPSIQDQTLRLKSDRVGWKFLKFGLKLRSYDVQDISVLLFKINSYVNNKQKSSNMNSVS